MFLSRHTTGICASLFHCSEECLHFLSRLHRLETSALSAVRDVRLKILHHVINGDCALARCSSSSSLPDRSACISIAQGFSSASSITTFVTDLLKGSTASVVTTQELLLVVESTGIQCPYRNRINLRRHLLRSLENFVQLSCRRQLVQDLNIPVDAYTELLSGFEQKRRPVLESIMTRHGLPLQSVPQGKKISSEEMKNTILQHIASGDCARSISKFSLSAKVPQTGLPDFHPTALPDNASCDDFVHEAELNTQMDNDQISNEIRALTIALAKISSPNTLLRLLQCKHIPHDPSAKIKRLRPGVFAETYSTA